MLSIYQLLQYICLDPPPVSALLSLVALFFTIEVRQNKDIPDEMFSDGWSVIEVLAVESIEGVRLYASSVTNEEGM